MSHESNKRKVLEKLVRDERAFDAANIEVSKLHDHLFAAIAVAASKMMGKDVDEPEAVAVKGVKRARDIGVDERGVDAKKRKV